MKPGVTHRPVASRSSLAGSESRGAMTAIFPSLTPISHCDGGDPRPSKNRPFLIIRSSMISVVGCRLSVRTACISIIIRFRDNDQASLYSGFNQSHARETDNRQPTTESLRIAAHQPREGEAQEQPGQPRADAHSVQPAFERREDRVVEQV